MKKHLLLSLITITLGSLQAWAFTFNGQTINENKDFTRSEICKADKSLEEISGIACSRSTEGYFWVHVDQGDPKIYALNPDGSIKQTVTLEFPTKNDDWEDICMASIDDKNYILIGCIGDNDVKDGKSKGKQTYYIYRIEEPEITGTNISIKKNNIDVITYTYDGTHNIDDCKDGKSHNAETLMFDPIDQKIYIATKHEKKINALYMTDWKSGSYTTTMQWVCDLGNLADMPKGSEKDPNDFLYLTAGDISADGSKILIKNKFHILSWERQGSESLSTTFSRTPQHIAAYREEEQGEAVAWANNGIDFYTASEGKEEPIFRFKNTQTVSAANETTSTCNLFVANGQLWVDNLNGKTISIYNLVGQNMLSNAQSPVNISTLRGIHIVRIGTFSKKVNFGY
ncbi:MAG: hypothetical protein LBR81_07865 [Prevotellaceae bacterium]|jgi:hypothetical protein|nr:hypothetical protein [Prevotellaceae bacterium]